MQILCKANYTLWFSSVVLLLFSCWSRVGDNLLKMKNKVKLLLKMNHWLLLSLFSRKICKQVDKHEQIWYIKVEVFLSKMCCMTLNNKPSVNVNEMFFSQMLAFNNNRAILIKTTVNNCSAIWCFWHC